MAHVQPQGFYQLCFRCHAAIPNGLIQNRSMLTSYSKYSTHWFARTEHFSTVALCGVCNQEVAEEEAHRGNARARHWGIFWGTMALAYAGVLWPIGLILMLGLAHYRMVGRALLTMIGIGFLYFRIATYPTQLFTLFVLPWVVTMGALMLWEVREKLPKLGLISKRPLLIEGKL